MSRQTFENWIPEEWGGAVITRIRAVSAIESAARGELMGSDTKHVPRSGGISFTGGVGKGVAYTEDGSTNDEVLLTAIKFGTVMRVADEDLKDTTGVANIIQIKQLDWARSYAIGFDNACLGTSAASNGTTIPFTSLYKALKTTNAAVSYTANANLTVTATGSALTYANVSTTFGMVETSNFWLDGEQIVIAHPSFRKALRNILDTQNRPIFIEAQSQAAGTPDTLLGLPVRWSLGARASGTATDSAAGNPLLFVGNPQYLIRGDRSGPEYMLAGADTGAAFLTDEALLKMRARRGFAVGNENAWAAIELAA